MWLQQEHLSTPRVRQGAKRNVEKLNMLKVVNCLEVLPSELWEAVLEVLRQRSDVLWCWDL
ncbi:hypothetical protein D3C73_1459450 [compost metagenome]